MKRKALGVGAACLLLAAAGCKKQETPSTAAPQQQYTAIDWNNAGTIEGTVHYDGNAPKPVEIDMGQDPACSLGPANYSQGYVVDSKGGFANVFVYVKDGLGNKVYAAPTQPVKIDQKGCRYIPHVVGVMAGQPVEFINSDPTMHNIHTTPTMGTNPSIDISQAPSQGDDRRAFSDPELMMPVRCNNHPWMQAFINVSSNPFYAVSDETGHFAIKGLPPGTYTVVADQENLGEKTATVTVGPRQTVTEDFTYSGSKGQ